MNTPEQEEQERRRREEEEADERRKKRNAEAEDDHRPGLTWDPLGLKPGIGIGGGFKIGF